MAVQLNAPVNKWSRVMKSAGIILGAAAMYMIRLEWHYKKHPESRQDGWLPLEWQSHGEIVNEYQKAIERASLGNGKFINSKE